MKRWLGLAIGIALLLAGPLKAGPADRVVVLCSPDPAWCELVKTEYTRQTGVQLDYLRMSSGEALARLRAEQQRPAFDVWFGGTGDPHFVAAAEGITEFHRPKAWRDLRPELTRVTDGKYIPLYTGLHGMAVNDALLTEKGLPTPERWTDLVKPVYRNLVATPNPNTSGTGYLLMTALITIYGEDRAFDLLKQIHRNVAQYTRSGGAPSLLTARGEVAIGVSFANDVVSNRVKGFRIRFLAPQDGTAFEIGGLSLVRGGPNRESAIRFIDWALTPEAQVLGHKALSFDIPSNPAVPVPIFVPKFEDARLIRYDFLRFGSPEVRERLIRRWDQDVFTLPR
jgi:iron(III) transport system substrate-binding protein